jgi:hypothetical protein
MNWSKASAIIGFIVLLLVGTHAALGIRDRLQKKPCTCPE